MSHTPVCGIEVRMREIGKPLHNEYVVGAGQILSLAGLPLGFLASDILSRRGRGSWLVGLGGIAVAFGLLFAGIFVTMSAFHAAPQ